MPELLVLRAFWHRRRDGARGSAPCRRLANARQHQALAENLESDLDLSVTVIPGTSWAMRAPTSDRLLEIYLADHLAASTAGVALSRRSAESNASTALGDVLRRLATEIEEDRRTLQAIVAELGFRESKAKNTLAWAGEKVARLKLNGQLRGYSPLSRIVELEALSVGVAGKLALWQSLKSTTALSKRLSSFDLDQLAERARRQRTEIEEQRINAVRETFGHP